MVPAIKRLRELNPGMGLTEAKNIVDEMRWWGRSPPTGPTISPH